MLLLPTNASDLLARIPRDMSGANKVTATETVARLFVLLTSRKLMTGIDIARLASPMKATMKRASLSTNGEMLPGVRLARYSSVCGRISVLV